MVLLRPRQCKRAASVALVCWLFAVFVGVVNGCALDEAFAGSHHVTTDVTEHQGQDGDAPTGCEQFCIDESPVPVKFTLIHDQPGEQTVLLAAVLGAPMVVSVAPVTSLHDRPHPPPGIALYTRFLHLAL